MKKLLSFMAGFACATILITYLTVDEPLTIEDTVCGEYPVELYTYDTDNVGVLKENAEDHKYVCDSGMSQEDSEESEKKLSHIIDAPYIYQMDAYPNACESVSAVMALKYLGFDIGVDRFIDEYLPMGERPVLGGIGPDPAMVYCGDPRSPYGWGCYSSVIVDSVRRYIGEGEYSVVEPCAVSLDILCREYINRDIPVIVWATIGMTDSGDSSFYRYWETPEGKEIAYNSKLHCLLLVGYDDENYYFNDPAEEDGKAISYPKQDCERAFSILGCQSIVIVND